MPILNYTTAIDADKSIAEIQKMLAKAGASAIMSEYDDTGNIKALSFRLKMNNDFISFTLPTDPRPVLTILGLQRAEARRSGKRFRTNVDEDQARRVAWRITKDWVEAQLAIIETRMVTTAQVFLPYAVTSTGESMYEHIAANSQMLLKS